ncbi:MAG: hypothetical protein C4575_09595 [Desulforudis sp.]|jgi:hypothetical protein|nr:MAG: hypothetical protein C4575_09595 [Desulforudis sp.]
MSFTKTRLPVGRYEFFQFFAEGSAAAMDESLAPGCAFELADIRLHLSVLHASAEYFRAYVSAVQGSAYNGGFISQLMSTVSDLYWSPSAPMLFQRGDQVRFTMNLSSANVWGLTVSGWSVAEPVDLT